MPDGTNERRARPQWANEYLVEFRRDASMESESKNSADTLGSGTRSTDARTSVISGFQKAQSGIQSRAGDCLRAGADSVSGVPELARRRGAKPRQRSAVGSSPRN